MTVNQNLKPVFQLLDNQNDDYGQAAKEVLGLWQVVNNPSSDRSQVTSDLAFATGSSSTTLLESGMPTDGQCWRTNLPDDLEQANFYLHQAEKSVQTSQQSLPLAERRLEEFITAQQQVIGPVFALATAPAPEAELLQLLTNLSPLPAGSYVSFGMRDVLDEQWKQITNRFQVFLRQLLKVVTHFAWVETYSGQLLLGRSSINWNGNTETLVVSNFSQQQLALHLQNQHLVVTSRQTLLLNLVLVVRLAAKLAQIPTMLASPLGPLLAIVSTWRFIQQVLDENK